MKSKRAALVLLKYMPILMAALMTNHCFMALFLDIDACLAEHTAAMSIMPAITLLVVSHAFGFCWLHKSFTIYVLLSSACMEYHREVGLGDTLTGHRMLFFVLGVLLFAILLYKFDDFTKCCYENNQRDA